MVSGTAAEQIVRQSPDALILVGQDGRIVYVNGAVTALFGYAADELVGRGIEQLVPKRFQAMHERYRQAFMAASVTREMGARVVDLSAVRKDGTEFPTEIRLAPIDVDGVNFVVAAVRDVTDRRRATEELQSARAEADRANRSKSRFLATASHDLRQPLQTLQLLTAALARQVTDPGGAALIQRQQSALDAMADLLNVLLDITKLESGTLQPALEDVVISDVVMDLQRQFQDVATARGLTLTIEPCHDSIRTDRVLFRQMLQNLLNNGLQYTRAGGVRLRTVIDPAHLVIEVADTGIGISKDQQERIFEGYYRIETPGISGRGFGLGLTIVRQICQLLGYDVSIESKEGYGTTFRIAIPLCHRTEAGARPAVQVKPDLDAPDVPKPAVLIVEDDNAVREALSLLLKIEGYPTFVAESPEAATAIFAREGSRIDFVITDFHLGNTLNGLQLLDELRAAANRDLPAVVLSGQASPLLDELESLSRVVLLRKPVDARRLIQTLETLFGAAAG